MNDLALVTELLAATIDAHSPRAMVRAIATTIAKRFSITRVELRPPAPLAIVELADGAWRHVDAGFAANARLVAPGLAIVGEPFGDELRAALTQVMASVARHLEVVQRVARLSQRAHAENRELRASLDRRGSIIARSPAMRAVMTRVEQVARHTTTVLVLGESGTGKELVAREIHRLSPRANRPLVQVNCGALPDTLLESELFGHERGAFTGADRMHAGAFERAHRGTLFLDEIGELSPAAQVKLLRVLQERQVRRVGGETQLDVDVRLIAATNRSLPAMVEQGAFREDLLYRLDVFSLRVPPLRERHADFGALVAALIDELAQRLNMRPPTISRRVLHQLEAHAWPGNVRELANVLETALILGGGDELVLPDSFARPTASPRGFDAAMRTTIEDALRTTRGKIYGRGGAAEHLGLKPATLQSKMKKLGIDRARFVARA